MAEKKDSLKNIFFSHSGKIADKWESYLDVYEEEFLRFRETQHPILEIGVQNCGSLEVWAKYFSQSKAIIGVDILSKLRNLTFDDSRINLNICDANNLHQDFLNNYQRPVIIIDDASHKSSDIIQTFMNMFPLLRDGGIYVAEDLCCAYWQKFNKNVKKSSMTFFKMISDIVNFEHWEQENTLKDYLKSMKIDLQQMLDIKTSIRSVKFYNSLCIVEKYKENSFSGIGARVVMGKESPLGFKAENNQSIKELKMKYRNFKFDDSDLS